MLDKAVEDARLRKAAEIGDRGNPNIVLGLTEFLIYPTAQGLFPTLCTL